MATPAYPDTEQLPEGIGSARIATATGLEVHYLHAGDAAHPVLLLLHGFPELAYSWRKIMPGLAQAGYYVIAPDQRGYGGTTGWSADYATPLEPYRMTSLVLDQLALLQALDIDQVAAVVGHDFGSPVAAWCALTRADKFQRLVMMSAPFAGPPGIRTPASAAPQSKRDLDAELARLQPPRKHYQSYYCTPAANQDMLQCEQGLQTFLAQYYYLKSGLWSANDPQPLADWQAATLAVMPGYYIMPEALNMPEVVAQDCAGQDLGGLDDWLSEPELAVYTAAFKASGFQGGLNWYRAANLTEQTNYLRLYAGCRINVPATFVAGRQDWGMYQSPGALTRMAAEVCQDFRGSHIIEGAGHWLQQEQPEAVLDCLLSFMLESR